MQLTTNTGLGKETDCSNQELTLSIPNLFIPFYVNIAQPNCSPAAADNNQMFMICSVS